MSNDIREPAPADDDIPVLTDIVVPGRLRSANPTTPDATSAGTDFVFDIDFEGRDRGVEFPPPPAAAPSPVAPTFPGPDSEPEAGADLDLPLPWAEPAPESTPESTSAPEPLARPERTEPLITAAVAKATAAVIEPPDADAQALLRELLAEIGAGLEQRLAQELAATEQRLRAALREELDTRLSELLAGATPKP